MQTRFGKNLTVELFGSSHGTSVGAICHGVPSGVCFSKDELMEAMKRRAPGQIFTTPRKEQDDVIFESGVEETGNGYQTTGTVLKFRIPNRNVKKADYEKMDYYRPSHGDYTYSVKYPGREDNRPSGRMTAPLIVIGLICEKYTGFKFCSHIKQRGAFQDKPLPEYFSEELYERLHHSLIPCVNPDGEQKIKEDLLQAQSEGDSLGATVETAVYGVPVGIGEPYFRGLDAILSAMLFSIPGVRSVSVGDGETFSRCKGSEANDPFIIKGGAVRTVSNHSGGINAGIANGMPVVFSAVFRPTPSISCFQNTVDYNGFPRNVSIQGRHDPCIALRAVPVVEACAAICLCDLYLVYQQVDDLMSYRNQIESIDNSLAQLLAERMECAEKIGRYKAKKRMEVYQPGREEQETMRIIRDYFADADLSKKEFIQSLMEAIYGYSRQIQENIDENN